MPRRSFNSVAQNDTDAEFRSWTEKIHLAIVAVGIIDTEATGDIDFATVSAPVGAYAKQGFKVYRFADALQATLPVFIRIDFGAGSSTDKPGLHVKVGTTHDGSGVLGGQLGVEQYCFFNSIAIADQHVSFVSGDTNFLSYAGFVKNLVTGASAIGNGLIVERTKSSTGVDTADGIITIIANSGTTWKFQILPDTGAVPSPETFLPIIIPAAGVGGSTVGGKVPVGVPVPFADGTQDPGKGMGGCSINDFRNGDVFPMTIYAADPDIEYVYCESLQSLNGDTQTRAIMRHSGSDV